MRNKRSVITGLAITGLAVTCLAGAGVVAAVGVPAVMAGIHTAPGPVAIPQDWPAGKAAGLRAEDQLREAAAGHPMVAPGSLEFGGLQRQAAERSAGGRSAGGRSAGTARDAQAGFTEGVIPLTHGGPFQPAQFLGTNLWNGPVGGRWEVVQAGGVPRDRALGAASPTRAAVFVYTRSANPASLAAPDVRGVIAPAAGPAGKFTITKVTGNILTLTADGSGKGTYHFDKISLRFTS